MASNSKAAQILDHIEQVLTTVPAVKSIVRDWPSFSEIKAIPSTALPRVAIVHDLPKSINWGHSTNEFHNRLTSTIPVSLFVYLYQSANQSAAVLSIVDDIFAALLVDPTHGGVADDTQVKPGVIAAIGPVVAGRMDVLVTYRHTGASL